MLEVRWMTQSMIKTLLPLQFVSGDLHCRLQCVRCFHLHVRLHTYPFPVCISEGIDGPYLRNGHAKVVVDAMENTRMSATGRCLAHQSGAFEHLQVVAELLSARPSRGCGQQIYRLVR